MVERHFDFERSLDNIVNNDDVMYETLFRIKADMKDAIETYLIILENIICF